MKFGSKRSPEKTDMRFLCFASSFLLLACGRLETENEHCVAPIEVPTGTFVSVPKQVKSKFPLAATTAGITMVISADRQSVDISYLLDGKAVKQHWRAKHY